MFLDKEWKWNPVLSMWGTLYQTLGKHRNQGVTWVLTAGQFEAGGTKLQVL